MNILFITHSFFPTVGGIESISEILAGEFVSAGHIVHLVTWSADNEGRVFAFEVLRSPGIRDLLKETIWADVVFENNPSFRLSWAAMLLFKPTVVALHTWIARPNGILSFTDRLKKIKLNSARAVIAVSDIIRKETFKSSIVIPNPFNSALFGDSNKSENLSDFVFLGRLVSDKGVDLAVKAISLLKASQFNCSLMVIGDGPEMNSLKELVMDLGVSDRVSFAGSLNGTNLVYELKKYRYMLIPSRWKEPFGVVALEGLACGCIPIVADGGGLPDAIGNAGLVFKRGDVDDLCDKMKIILSDPELQKNLKLLGNEQLKNHQPKLIAARYLEVIENALK